MSNPLYAVQLRQHKLAWTPGTEEYARRKAFPGPLPPCADPECARNPCAVPVDTYWICQTCKDLAPDPVPITHAPSANVRSAQKKAQAAAAALLGIVLLRKYELKHQGDQVVGQPPRG